ncbi:uncharacterized protein LOC126899261 isoform X2 [Daktulosphaira vitifoliae]|uniref:uncharacterized protein LOC126899261 isoform X2 n=1 Tax=Daktulosphaira vitifoliae TaxID=58002 RepID=UPI0021A9E9B4|nr:uncharacterized protein LOC126899261 isoform X2 [Daktulosphaira vitifoliae]
MFSKIVFVFFVAYFTRRNVVANDTPDEHGKIIVALNDVYNFSFLSNDEGRKNLLIFLKLLDNKSKISFHTTKKSAVKNSSKDSIVYYGPGKIEINFENDDSGAEGLRSLLSELNTNTSFKLESTIPVPEINTDDFQNSSKDSIVYHGPGKIEINFENNDSGAEGLRSLLSELNTNTSFKLESTIPVPEINTDDFQDLGKKINVLKIDTASFVFIADDPEIFLKDIRSLFKENVSIFIGPVKDESNSKDLPKLTLMKL